MSQENVNVYIYNSMFFSWVLLPKRFVSFFTVSFFVIKGFQFETPHEI